jgi:outer membrane receptor protein involved in Fe transport
VSVDKPPRREDPKLAWTKEGIIMKRALALCLVSSAPWSVVTPALAQSVSTPPTTLDPQGASGATVADIVVTAQRRSENLQKVPIAVSAFSSADLQAASIKTTANLVSITPALNILNSTGFIEPRIRGIGNTSAGPGVENSVAAYVDGVYISSAPGSLTSLSNVERVEVLKGPQGTLFGRNATGGLIQVITKDPSDTFNGQAHIGYGSFKTVTGDLYLSAPLQDGTAINLAASGSHMGDGYGRNLTNGQEINKNIHDISVRSKLVSHLGPSTTVRLIADYARQKSSDPSPVAASGTSTSAYRDVANQPIFLFQGKWDGQVNSPIYHSIHAGGVSLKVDQQIGDATLTSTTAYRVTRFRQVFDADFSPAQSVFEDYTQKDRQFSQELQLASSQHGSVRWVIGAYYFHLNARFDPFGLIFGAPPAQRYSYLNDTSLTESFSGYAQATWAFNDTTNLTGGVRYTRDSRSLSGTTTAISAANVTTITSIPFAKTIAKVPTWRISLDHNFTPDLMGYVSWNRGFKSGGFNPGVPTAPAYAPEKLDAYEVGLKSVLLSRKLRLNAAAFYYDYRKIQVNTFLGSIGVIYNGAKAEVYGLDADFDFAATNRLRFNGGAVLLHDRFTNFPLASVSRPLGNGLYSLMPGDATGNRLPFAADATFSLGMRYTMPLANGSAVFAVSELHNTGYFTQADNRLHQGAFDQINSSLTWNMSNGLSAKLFVNNLLNKAVAVNDVISAAATIVSYAPPRTYGIELGYKF